ncbi:MAG: AI-2E family transporter [Acidobacteriota bacterium]|nr:AI-2E family transporter [Acidobacteriota bacterium]
MSRVRIPESSASTSVLLFAGILLLLVFAKVILIPLAFALTLSFLLVPAVVWLEHRGLPRKLAVAIVALLTCMLLALGAYVVSRQVLSVATTLPGYRANIQRKIASVHSSSASSLEGAVNLVEDMARQLAASRQPEPENAVRVQVVGQRSDQLQATAQMVGTILEPIGQAFIVIIFTIYMLLNREDLRHRLLLLAGMGNINVMTQALEEATSRISRYLVMQFQVNACYGITFGAGLYLLHVPEATLWGVIAGALRIVPYAGVGIGTFLPFMLSIAVSSTWWTPLLVLGLFLTLELTLANVIEPWLFSSHTGISSLALLGSAIFWSMIWGWPGLALSTPLTVCVVVLGRYVPQLSFLHTLLGTNAKLSPAARLYERLLAMDETEAWTVVKEFLVDDRPLFELYDSVLIPVLSLAEEDRHKGALSDVRWKFCLLCIGELIARYSEYQADKPRSLAIGVDPSDKPIAVVCTHAPGEANELAAVMLSNMLQRAGYHSLLLSADAVSEYILRGLAAESETVVFISALPPFAFGESRKMCQQVREYLAGNRVAIALWDSQEDTEETLTRFGSVRPDVVVTTVTQSVLLVESWQRAMRSV